MIRPDTAASGDIAWSDVVWTHPPAIACDLNGPAQRPFTPVPENFTDQLLSDLLAAVAAPDPNAVAIVGSTERLTYADLLELIVRVARHLAALVPDDGAIATLLPNTPSGFAAMLACLVAARICIVLDAAHPAERNATILADARPAAVLFPDDQSADAAFGIPQDTARLSLRALTDAPLPASPPIAPFDQDAPALVHFTSGSTGRPKGIAVSMRAMLRRARVYLDGWHITREDRFLATIQPSNNAGFCANVGALCGGARLLLHSLAGQGAGSLFALARDEGLTLLDAGPSIMRLLTTLDAARPAFSHVRILRSTGEAVLQADLANWRAVLPADCHITHAYGSTEAMYVAHWFVPPDYTSPDPRLPAGYPLPDQAYALVDESGRTVPPGEPGEIVLHSQHVACGEWRDGRAVPGRMQPDPSRPGWHYLRTGDMLRLGPDGMLRFVSRADRQVKVHGVRIEPAEIESILRTTPGVTDAAVVAGRSGEETVLQAVVAADPAYHAELRATLRERLRKGLPPAMRPAQIITLERMPYLPGGKIDMGALASPDAGRSGILTGLLAMKWWKRLSSP